MPVPTMPIRFDLRQLQHLILLVEECHFARAAERACLSQSAFSRSIQALETALGMVLIDRDPKGVRPTPAGARLAERARHLLFDCDNIQRELALLEAGEMGLARVGAGAFLGASLLPEPLAELRRAYPAVRAQLRLIDTDLAADKLIREELDFYVGECESLPRGHDFTVERLGHAPCSFFCRADHPLRAQAACTLAELQAAGIASSHIPRALFRDPAGGDDALHAALQALVFESENLAVLRELALTSDTVLLAPDGACERELAQGLLWRLSPALEGRAPSFEVGIVRVGSRTPTPASVHLMGLIREAAGRRLMAQPA